MLPVSNRSTTPIRSTAAHAGPAAAKPVAANIDTSNVAGMDPDLVQWIVKFGTDESIDLTQLSHDLSRLQTAIDGRTGESITFKCSLPPDAEEGLKAIASAKGVHFVPLSSLGLPADVTSWFAKHAQSNDSAAMAGVLVAIKNSLEGKAPPRIDFTTRSGYLEGGAELRSILAENHGIRLDIGLSPRAHIGGYR